MQKQRDFLKEMHSQRSSKQILEISKDYSYDYLNKIENMRIFPDKESLSNLRIFNEDLPYHGSESKEVLELLHQYGSPNTVLNTCGRYYGYVTGNALPVSLGARWLADIWNQNSGMYNMSPIVSKLEETCERWLIDLFGLNPECAIGFVSGTTSATQTGLIIARDSILENLGWDIKKDGLNGAPDIQIVLSEQAHSSVFKILTAIGFGQKNMRRVPADEHGRICVDKIGDITSNTILIIQAGNVNTGAFDSICELCDIAHNNNAWVHVDGAFGLWAATSEKTKHLTKGIEKADSISTDAHKTLNIPYDSGIIICRHRKKFLTSMHAKGDYLIYSDQKRDGMNYTPEMSRRSRIIEFWAALKYLGKQGVSDLVEHFFNMASKLALELKRIGYSILNDVVFNQLLVFYNTSKQTEEILEYLQNSGEIWCGGSKWDEKSVIRISVCSWATNEEDIFRTVNIMKKAIIKLD